MKLQYGDTGLSGQRWALEKCSQDLPYVLVALNGLTFLFKLATLLAKMEIEV